MSRVKKLNKKYQTKKNFDLIIVCDFLSDPRKRDRQCPFFRKNLRANRTLVGSSSVTLFILEFVRSVVINDFTERTDSLISVVNN